MGSFPSKRSLEILSPLEKKPVRVASFMSSAISGEHSSQTVWDSWSMGFDRGVLKCKLHPVHRYREQTGSCQRQGVGEGHLGGGGQKEVQTSGNKINM